MTGSDVVTVTLDRSQRDGMRGHLVYVLAYGTVDDFPTHVAQGRYQAAQELRTRFEDRTALLDQLGWAHQDPRDEFAITLDRTQFQRVIGALRWETTVILANSTMPEWQEHEAAEIAKRAYPAYRAIFAQLPSATCQRCVSEADSTPPRDGSASEHHQPTTPGTREKGSP